jgi:hypothetical protein
MTKFSCTMVGVGEVFHANVIAETMRQAKEIAAAETGKGRPREWSARVLENDVEGPARFLGAGAQEA